MKGILVGCRKLIGFRALWGNTGTSHMNPHHITARTSNPTLPAPNGHVPRLPKIRDNRCELGYHNKYFCSWRFSPFKPGPIATYLFPGFQLEDRRSGPVIALDGKVISIGI